MSTIPDSVAKHLLDASDAARQAVELARGLLAALDWWTVRDREGDAPSPECLEVFVLPLLARVGACRREVEAAQAALRAR
jgi:hypothetical protein